MTDTEKELRQKIENLEFDNLKLRDNFAIERRYRMEAEEKLAVALAAADLDKSLAARPGDKQPEQRVPALADEQKLLFKLGPDSELSLLHDSFGDLAQSFRALADFYKKR